MSSDESRADVLRMDFGTVLAAVLTRWVRIAVVTVAVLLATFGVVSMLPKLYESSASLLVEPRDNAYMRAANGPASGSMTDLDALLASQIELIRSRDLLLEVVDAENLRSVPEFAGTGFAPMTLVLQLIGRQPEPRSLDAAVLSNLADRMTVVRERNSAVISIHVRSTNPELAARIANAIAETHVKRRGEQSLADAADATVWLEQEITRLRKKVADADTAIANYRVDNNIFLGASATPVTDQQLSAVTAQIAEAQQRSNAAQSRAELIRGLVNAGRPLDGVSDVRQSAVIQGLLSTGANLRAELAQSSTRLLDNHPTIKALKAQIAEIDRQIANEGRRVADALDAEAKVEADLEQKLRNDLTRARSAVGDATRGGVTLEALQREAKADRDLLESSLARYADATARTGTNSALPDVRVVSTAAASAEPASPNIPWTLAVVGFAALALQLGGVVLAELLPRRTPAARGATDAEEAADAVAAEDDAALLELSEEPADDVDAFIEDAELEDGAEEEPEAMVEPVVAASRTRTVLLVALTSFEDGADIAESLISEAMAEGLSAVEIDAGSGILSAEEGLTDLSAGLSDYGDVVHRVHDDLATVPWGRLATIDRRSLRPATLIAALADIYHLVVVNSGRVGMASSLPLFAGSEATVLLVADAFARPVDIAAARRDVEALGFSVEQVITVSEQQAKVA